MTLGWADLLGTPVAQVEWEHGHQARLVLGDGRQVFAKAGAVDGLSRRCQAAEVAGLRWLAEAKALPVAEVVAQGPGAIATNWIEPGEPSVAQAEDFGRGLARLHRAGANSFGAPWPGCIGPLAQSNRPRSDWVTFFAEERLAPWCEAAADAHALSPDALKALEAVIADLADLGGPPESPSRIHGDLWSGNVLWDGKGPAWLIDPAAHGGHRESDLAMLALFGVRHLERILAAYREEYPLADGWRRRLGLHQLHPLLVHAVLFGPSYGRRAGELATELLDRRRRT